MQRPALTSRPVISSLYLFFDVYLPSYISSRKRRLFSISTFGLYDDRDRDSRDQRRENQMKKRWEKSERDTEKSETTDDRKSLSDNKVSHVLMYEGTWFIISKYEMTGKEREATGRRQQRHECGWKGSQRERCKGRKNRWITERERENCVWEIHAAFKWFPLQFSLLPLPLWCIRHASHPRHVLFLWIPDGQ